MTDGPSDALLLEAFGPRLIAYLCNVNEKQIGDRFREGSRLSEEAEAALRQLVPLAERVAKERLDHPGFPLSLSLDVLGTVPDGADTSIGNLVRISAGGEIDTGDTGAGVAGDHVKQLLFRLARDVYPQLLVPAEEPWHHTRLSFFRHPLRAELQRAVHEDEQLSRMYPSEDGDLGRRGMVFNSLGRGGTVQSVMFGETVIHAAWDLAIMSTSSPSLADLYRAIGASVDVLRSAISGRPTETRALMAFTGITTSSRAIETPWGRLRPITDDERASAPSMLDGAVSGTDPEGRTVTVAYAGELVLDTALPFELNVHEWRVGDELPAPPLQQLKGFDALRRRSEGIQLAVLLATERPTGRWSTARLTWQWIADPTAQGRSIGWADPKSAPSFMPTELSEEECEALREWCELIDANWSPAIDIAVRRVLSAAQVRTDASDRLVDAVIAWENLFGTSEGEPRLRVSSAMAWLLADTAAGRSDLQREVKQLYDDRSKIVHGGRFNETAISEKADRALNLALSSLRVLFRARSDVLSLPDGSARSLRLILDG